MTTVLIALTGAAKWTMKDGSALPSGFWAEELIDPQEILTAAGINVVLATPGGVAAPLQGYSLDESMTGSAERTAELRAALAGLEDVLAHPKALAAVAPDSIDAVFVPGGTGPMEDLHNDPELGRILVALQARTAPVATVCHGTIGLLSARSGDVWIFAGYQMTGYTDQEESQDCCHRGSGEADVQDEVSEAQVQYSAAGPVHDERQEDDGQNCDHQPEEKNDNPGKRIPAYCSRSSHGPPSTRRRPTYSGTGFTFATACVPLTRLAVRTGMMGSGGGMRG